MSRGTAHGDAVEPTLRALRVEAFLLIGNPEFNGGTVRFTGQGETRRAGYGEHYP